MAHENSCPNCPHHGPSSDSAAFVAVWLSGFLAFGFRLRWNWFGCLESGASRSAVLRMRMHAHLPAVRARSPTPACMPCVRASANRTTNDRTCSIPSKMSKECQKSGTSFNTLSLSCTFVRRRLTVPSFSQLAAHLLGFQSVRATVDAEV